MCGVCSACEHAKPARRLSESYELHKILHNIHKNKNKTII
jgi:hypothetical protein